MTNHPKKATTGAAEAPEASEVPDQQSVSSSIENGQTQPPVHLLIDHLSHGDLPAVPPPHATEIVQPVDQRVNWKHALRQALMDN